MTRYVIAAMALLFTAPAWAEEEDWSTTDSIAEATVQTAIVVDWVTTLGPRPVDCYESNPILGSNPTNLEVSVYFAATMIGHYLIARLLPQPWRRFWQGVVLGVEVAAVTNNLVVGGGLRAQW